MTSPSPSSVSSTPVLRATLVWSAAAAGALAVVGAILGFITAGWSGVWSAVVGIALAVLFLALTAISILIANRWYGDPLYVPIFFGSVMGAWIIKFALFIVALFVLRDQLWLNTTAFFLALVASVIVSLVIDVVVMLRMRIPHASDVSLPTMADIEAGENQTLRADQESPRD